MIIDSKIIELTGKNGKPEIYQVYIKEIPCRLNKNGSVELTAVRAFIKKIGIRR